MIQQNMLRVDPPSVVVGGEVVNPGRYLLTGNLRVSDAVEMAGGLNRSADSGSADLMQYAMASSGGPLVATHAERESFRRRLSKVTPENQDVTLR